MLRINTRIDRWKSQRGRCVYCNEYVNLEQASLDHIIPVQLGDDEINHPENLVMTCKKCNRNKGNFIVFSSLVDKCVYPIIETPYFFRIYDILYNFRDKN